MILNIECPAHARGIIEDTTSRYLVLHSGRGGGKSYLLADKMIARMHQRFIRAVVCRELKTTIADSVHRLLKDRIAYWNLSENFRITDNSITCLQTGSELTYKHLRDNVTEVKGLEGCDVAWIFEAENCSADSFAVLDPTIRKPGSQIWIEFNPNKEDDYVYNRFVAHRDPMANVIELNYLTNPWCPQELIMLANECRRRSKAEYQWIWMGKCCGVGRFFNVGPEHECDCFRLPLDCENRLIGSLDHGIAHYTSFGLWYVESKDRVYRLFSYLANGGTTEGHAIAIREMINEFPFAHGYYPPAVYYDPSMSKKHKLSEAIIRAEIDEYKDAFAMKIDSRSVRFVEANNRKEHGCSTLRGLLDNDGGKRDPDLLAFRGYNQSFVKGLQYVTVDENNAEIYAKQDGDDAADEARYGAVAVRQMMATLERQETVYPPKMNEQAIASLSSSYREAFVQQAVYA